MPPRAKTLRGQKPRPSPLTFLSHVVQADPSMHSADSPHSRGVEERHWELGIGKIRAKFETWQITSRGRRSILRTKWLLFGGMTLPLCEYPGAFLLFLEKIKR